MLPPQCLGRVSETNGRPTVMSWAARFPEDAASAMASPDYRSASEDVVEVLLRPAAQPAADSPDAGRHFAAVTESPEIGCPFLGSMPFGGSPSASGWLSSLGYPTVWSHPRTAEAYMTALAVASGTYGGPRYTASALDMSIASRERPYRRLWEGRSVTGVSLTVDYLSIPPTTKHPKDRANMHAALTRISDEGLVSGFPSKVGRHPSDMYDLLLGTDVLDTPPAVAILSKSMGFSPDSQADKDLVPIYDDASHAYRYNESRRIPKYLKSLKVIRTVSAQAHRDGTRIVWMGVLVTPGQTFGEALGSAGLL